MLKHFEFDTPLDGCYVGTISENTPNFAVPLSEIGKDHPLYTIEKAIENAKNGNDSELSDCSGDWWTLNDRKFEKLKAILSSIQQVAYYFSQPSDHLVYVDIWQEALRFGGQPRIRFTLEQMEDKPNAWSINWIRKLGAGDHTTMGISEVFEHLFKEQDLDTRGELIPSIEILFNAILLARQNDLPNLANFFAGGRIIGSTFAMLSSVKSVGCVSLHYFLPVGLKRDNTILFGRCHVSFQGRSLDNKIFDARLLLDWNFQAWQWQITSFDEAWKVRDRS